MYYFYTELHPLFQRGFSWETLNANFPVKALNDYNGEYFSLKITLPKRVSQLSCPLKRTLTQHNHISNYLR